MSCFYAHWYLWYIPLVLAGTLWWSIPSCRAAFARTPRVLADSISSAAMAKFPRDFWRALKAGDTSDWKLWVTIVLIIGALFVLLCIVRCCMRCFERGKKDDASCDSDVPDRKTPPVWLNHIHTQPSGTQPHVRTQPVSSYFFCVVSCNFYYESCLVWRTCALCSELINPHSHSK
jgi:hypothetical protein